MNVNERAKTFIEHRLIPKRLHELSTICYINGAIEQRKIDIDKACEWLIDNLWEFVDYDHCDGINIDYGELNKQFRKVIEEEF